MKNFKKLATLLLTIALAFSVSACLPDLSEMSSSTESESSIGGGDVTVYEYSLNLDSFSIDVGASRTLRVIAEPEKEDIEAVWESEDAQIATVSEEGEVTGVSEGTTKITATVDGQVLECAVTVNALPIVYEYSLDITSRELTIGEDLQLNVIVTPATEENVSVQWSSSANSVATVNNGLVQAVSAGSATISALVEDQTLTCEITVVSPVTVSVSSAMPENADITNNHDTYDTLYWEHYSNAGERSKMFALKDYVSTNLFDICSNAYGDYKIPLSYNDGTGNLAYAYNRNGLHTPAGQETSIEFVIAIDENVKAIRVYAGVWNATHSINLLWGDVVVATAESIVAGGDSQAREITFVIDEIDPSITQLKLVATASNLSGGNISIPAIVILGTDTREASNVTVNYSKVEMPNRVDGNPENEIFLTEYGTQDWIYLNKHDVERKSGGNMIIVDSLDVEGNNSFDDYKGNFQWSDGTTNAISSGVNDNGQFGSWATIKTKIDADTDHVYFWVGGYSSTYYFEAYDSKGNIIASDLLHEEVGGTTFSYMIDLAVSVEGEETIMLNIYRTGGANCSLAALAVHKEVTYSYSFKQADIEFQAGTTFEKLEVVATPDRRFNVAFVSANEEIATVDANGIITAISEGETTIAAIIDGQEIGLVANVKVTPAPIEYSYSLDKESAQLMPGMSVSLAVIITPTPTEAPAVVWSSNYPEIAEVVDGVVTAKADGEATITAEVDGKVLTCVITVETVATATVTTTAENPYEVNLTDNDASLTTIYWEHYAGTNIERSSMNEDIIDLVPGGRGFGDFGIRFRWFDGSNARVGNHNRNGSHTSGDHVVEGQIAVDQNVKAIRVYAGAWKGTNTVSLLYNGFVIAQAESFTAGDGSQAREITFNVNVTKALNLTLRAEGSNIKGNISLNAVVVLGNKEKQVAVASLALAKTSLIIPEGQRKDINLTEIGSLDWFVPETNLVDGDPYDIDEKAGADYIDSSSFTMSFYNWYGDFGYDRVFFNWSDGTNFPQIGTDRDRNDGRWGSIASVKTKVDANVEHVYLWTSGWNCSYSIAVIDSKGNIIFDQEVVAAQGNNQPYLLNFAVDCVVEETLSFVLYGTSSDNCSILAMAVSNVADYEYTANRSEVTLFEEETSDLLISVSPAKDIHVEYSSSAEGVATVDAYGVITAVGVGQAVITATVDGKEFTCNVTVEARPVDYTYSVNATEKELIPTGTFQIEVSVSPSKEMNLTFVSANDGIAQVDTNGLVTAIANGNVRIDVLDDGVVVASLNVTVKTYVEAGAVSVVNGDGQNVNLTFASADYPTIYWERYYEYWGVKQEKMLNATDLIVHNTISEHTSWFDDYKARVEWSNGTDVAAWGDLTSGNNAPNRAGICYGGQTVITIAATPAVKQIILYTGAWNASAYATLALGETVLATSETWSAGGTGIARFVTFNVNVLEACTLTITINPTPVTGTSGNANMVAVAITGIAPQSTTTVALEKTLLPAEFVTVDDKSQPSVSYDLTTMGTIDWLYANFENQGSDEMLDGSAIQGVRQDGDGKFWDYKAILTFSNGTRWNTTAGHDKDSDTTYGTNNGICGGWVQANVLVDENTNNVHLFIGGYESTYSVMVVGANGAIIFNEQLNEGTASYYLNFAINASQAEQLSFIVYKTVGNNCSLAAVAVS